jgi:hypothetical protein
MVKDNMKLFSKRQIAGATQAKDLFKKMIFPSTVDFRQIVSAGGVPGSDVTLKDVKAVEVIWECSILKMKGNTVRRNGKKVVQSIIKVLKELIKLHQDVKLAIDIFCQKTHLLHDLQYKDQLLHSHSFGILQERSYLRRSPGDIQHVSMSRLPYYCDL